MKKATLVVVYLAMIISGQLMAIASLSLSVGYATRQEWIGWGAAAVLMLVALLGWHATFDQMIRGAGDD